VAVVAGAVIAASAGPKAPAKPARIDVSVSPKKVAPGGQAQVTLQLVPAQGIKIPRYPKMKLTVPAQEGLVQAAEAAVGNDSPPPPDQVALNYYKKVEPLELDLRLDPGASSGKHEISAKFRYFYCQAATGMCVPARTEIKIPVIVKGS
jgi:hypothetical protein